ncbi:hypothetical protein OJAV_G00165520 [Oryzias javanicus]|uniref:Transmembrane protein 176 n=1 Tax=Oryzias javanicus TaxID=123683 RepID=A0A3S2PCL2_ORYJA|nr:hypothetical protein OJAV_G00165520 [Oryzias javanicus]
MDLLLLLTTNEPLRHTWNPVSSHLFLLVPGGLNFPEITSCYSSYLNSLPDLPPCLLWPPLCQVGRSLCCHPTCCSASRQLRGLQRSSLSVLGVVQVMVGLLHIGLGAVLTISLIDLWWMRDTGFPYWTGVLCIVFGTVCILSEAIHSPCLVLVNGMLNVAAAAFAISAIVVYSINMTDIYLRNTCREDYYEYATTPSPGSAEEKLEMRCLEGRQITMMIQRGINSVLIILSVLQLCVTVSSAVLSIAALCGIETKIESSDDLYKPLLEDVSAEPEV